MILLLLLATTLTWTTNPYSETAWIDDELLLKQVRQSDTLELIIDALACEIAQDMGVTANHVELISQTELTDIKRHPAHLATLHTKAPGKLTEELVEWRDLEIGQRIRPFGSPQYKRYGPLPEKRCGLTWHVVKEAARHPQLPAIVALDTYLGNRDRWGNNLFYDDETDTFTAIDFGEAYKHNLMREAALRLSTPPQNLSPNQQQAFKQLCLCMQQLTLRWPEERIQDRFCALLQKGNVEEDASVHAYRQKITENCSYANTLLETLNQALS